MEVSCASVLAELEKVNSELACLRPSYELLARIERLKLYLQAPDSSSEFADYQRFQRNHERAVLITRNDKQKFTRMKAGGTFVRYVNLSPDEIAALLHEES